MTDFWRVLRVIAARRWVILACMLIAAVAVFALATLQSQRKQYEAEALLEPQDLPLAQVLGTAPGADGQPAQTGGAAGVAADRTSRVSDLVMLLRSSNDLYLKTARLLREDEKDRAQEVGEILTRNGYFATYDANIATQANSLVKVGQLASSQKQQWIKDQRAALRTQAIDSLAKASDTQGSFAPTGVKKTETEIAAEIGKKMSFDTVAGPLNTETAPQIVNQIRVSGIFEREAEANLYVNMLCVAFIDFYTIKSAAGANVKLATLNEKLKQAEARLNQQRNALAAFRRQKGVVATSQQEQLVAQVTRAQDTYNQVVQDLQEADGQVLSLRQALLTARQSVATRLPSTQNPQVAALRSQETALRIQLENLRGRGLGERNPEVLPIRAQLAETRRLLAQEINTPYVTAQPSDAPANLEVLLNQAQSRRDGLQNRLAALSQQLNTLNRQVLELPQVQNRLNELTRSIQVAERSVQEIDSSRSRYELLAVDNGRAGTVSIISQASAQLVGGDIAARRGLLALLAGLLTGVLCVAGVILFDVLDPSVRTQQDAERLFGLPVEGIIPEQTPDPMLAAWVTYRSPDSPVAEAYRLLRTRLLFTAAEHPFQSLVLVTGRPGQGSTTTAANLAITLAQDGKRVILVDANLRDPQLHSLFHASNEVGLTTLLTVNLRLEDVVRPTAIANMELLPAGPMPLNPSELLGSPRMRYIHHELKKRADFILFDTPSVIAFSDAAILSSYVDATLLVVRANNVPRESEKQVRSLLEKARANLIGMVFNAVPADRVDAVGYHAHYYAASRRPDDAIGAAPDADFGQPDGRGGYGDMTPSDGELSLAVLGENGQDGGAVHPVSPFTEPAVPETAPTNPTAPAATQPTPRRPAGGQNGYHANGNGNGNGRRSNGSGPTAFFGNDEGGVATLAPPAPAPDINGHGDHEPEGVWNSAQEIWEDLSPSSPYEPRDEDARRLIDGDTTRDADMKVADGLVAAIESIEDTEAAESTEADEDVYDLLLAAGTRFRSTEPPAFHPDPAADSAPNAAEEQTAEEAESQEPTEAENAEVTVEAEAAEAVTSDDAKNAPVEMTALVPVTPYPLAAEELEPEPWAPPVESARFSSAATPRAGMPATLAARSRSASRWGATVAEPKAGRATLLLWGLMLVIAALVGGITLAVGAQINVR